MKNIKKSINSKKIIKKEKSKSNKKKKNTKLEPVIEEVIEEEEKNPEPEEAEKIQFNPSPEVKKYREDVNENTVLRKSARIR